MKTYLLLFFIFSLLLPFSSAEQCGCQAEGALCTNNLCLSEFGWCGDTEEYCNLPGCQSQCTPGSTPPSPGGTPPSPGGTPPGPGDTPPSPGGTPPGPGDTPPSPGGTPPGPGDTPPSPGGTPPGPGDTPPSPGGTPPGPGDTPPSPGGTPPGPGDTPPSPGGTPPGPGDSPPAPVGDLSNIITRSQFERMLKHRNDAPCPARNFYTYNAFITAANSFPRFGTTGNITTRKREIAAFFGQTSHETTGGWPTAPDGPYAWGYCYKQERNPPSIYCRPSAMWPCARGKRYYGRGPMQLTWNYNYGPCGRAIRVDLLNNPDLVANNAVIAFKSAIWFWMTAQPPKPSSHAVIVGQWRPSAADIAARRVPGYGVITNIINGGLECGHGPDPRVADRIGFYRRYCTILGVNPGRNLDCYNQRAFGRVFLDAAI